MENFTKRSLDEFISYATRKRIIDSCERQDEGIVIVQGYLCIVLNPERAHAFLRGLINATGEKRECSRCGPDMTAGDALKRLESVVNQGNSFRLNLLENVASYRRAGFPFGDAIAGFSLWMKYGARTTSN